MRFISCPERSTAQEKAKFSQGLKRQLHQRWGFEDVNFYDFDSFHLSSRGALLSKMRRQWVRNDWRSPTDSTRSLLLTTIFLLIFLVRLKRNPFCHVFLFLFDAKSLSPGLTPQFERAFSVTPLFLDIWQVFSHFVAFPKESSTHSYLPAIKALRYRN